MFSIPCTEQQNITSAASLTSVKSTSAPTSTHNSTRITSSVVMYNETELVNITNLEQHNITSAAPLTSVNNTSAPTSTHNSNRITSRVVMNNETAELVNITKLNQGNRSESVSLENGTMSSNSSDKNVGIYCYSNGTCGKTFCFTEGITH